MKALLSGILILFATTSFADSLSVRAADHEGFSRVVFYGQSEQSWSLLKTAEGYLLRSTDAQFDLSQVFTRMGRDRLLQATQTPEGVFLEVDCPCHVNAFFLAPDMIVVDVNDGVAEDLGVARRQLTETERAGLRAALNHQVKPVEIENDGIEDALELAESISTAEALLIEQLGRAASQGLAKPRLDLQPNDNALSPMADRLPSIGSAVLSTSTSLDLVEEQTSMAPALSCLPEDWFPNRDWIVGESFSAGLGTLRASLFDETDQADPKAHLALARHYVAHGFTLEASRIIGSDLSPEASALKSMILLIDDPKGRLPPSTGQDGCTGTQPVWRFLSTDQRDQSEADRKSVLAAVSSVPPDLAVILEGRFLDAARRTEDADFMAGMATQLGYLTGQTGYESAAQDEIDPAADAAVADLLAHARSADVTAKDALLEYVSISFHRQLPVAADVPDLVGAYLFEAKGTDIYGAFRLAELMVLALMGEFATVFAEADVWTESTDFGQGLYALLVAKSTDAQFARRAREPLVDLPAEVRLKLAERLLQIGFYEDALRVLPNDSHPETRLLRATAFFELQNLQDALTELSGQEGAKAVALRAKINAYSRNYGNASDAFADLDRSGDATRMSLLSMQSEKVRSRWNEDEATHLLSEIPTTNGAPLKLEDGRNLVEAIRKKSASVQSALQEFAEP